MTNAPSLLESEAINVEWTTSEYRGVCKYKGDNDAPYKIKNTISGTIDKTSVKINQGSKDYGVNNQYTIAFTPNNPIPKLGWISLKYPDNVKIVDSNTRINSMDKFLNGVDESGSDPKLPAIEAYTAGSYSGSDYAFVDDRETNRVNEDNRVMYFHSAFLD
jgi:hypothetical protein